MCIVGYFVESLEPTAEEKALELDLQHYHIESYWDWTDDAIRIWTQEEYDNIVRDGWHIEPWTLYVVRDD